MRKIQGHLLELTSGSSACMMAPPGDARPPEALPLEIGPIQEQRRDLPGALHNSNRDPMGSVNVLSFVHVQSSIYAPRRPAASPTHPPRIKLPKRTQALAGLWST